jgi:hypothetical protein
MFDDTFLFTHAKAQVGQYVIEDQLWRRNIGFAMSQICYESLISKTSISSLTHFIESMLKNNSFKMFTLQ